jgi:hypothetical protein
MSQLRVRQGEGPWHAPSSTQYANEAALQGLIQESPELLPWGDPAEVIMCRELEVVSVGSVDIAAVSLSGEISLIECKLRSNSEIRRHVIGQLLAYASGVQRMTYGQFEHSFSVRIDGGMEAAMTRVASETQADWTLPAFRGAVSSNLRAGRFGLLVAVDEITEELMRTVEFLNAHTVADLTVAALELRIAEDSGFQILMTGVYGQESAAPNPVVSGRRRTTEAELFETLARDCSPAGFEAMQMIYRHAQEHGHHFYWGDGATPSVTAWLPIEALTAAAWSCYAYPGHPSFDVNFEWLARKGVAKERLDTLIQQLSELTGVAKRLAGVPAANYLRRPSFPIDEFLTLPGAATTIIAALDALMADG